MFFSALTLAAMLQTAPEASLKVRPPKGYALGPARSLDELNLRLPKSRSVTIGKPERVTAWHMAPPVLPRFVRDPQAADCKNAAPLPADNRDTLAPQSLSKMPPAHREFAVQRKIDGCTVAVPMDGRAAVF